MRAASSGGRPATAAALKGRNHTIEAERAVSRKELAATARDAMKGLDLRPSERLVLAELVGCWGEKMIAERILVYPSNEYLMGRTGLSERAIRYGIRRMIERGLVTPKDSANGKRFAIRNRAGEVVDVYGLDLTPLYARRSEFVRLVYAQKAENEERARLFDEITICRRAAEQTLVAIGNGIGHSNRMDSLRQRTPRRNSTIQKEVLVPVVEAWRSLRAELEEIFYQAASGGKECQHIETKPSESINQNLEQGPSGEGVRGEDCAPGRAPFPVALVVEACPSLLDYTEKPETEVDLVAAGRFLRSALGAHATVWAEAVEALGPIEAATAVCVTLELHARDPDRIRNPGGYLRAMVRMVKDRRINLRTELLTLIRKRNDLVPPTS